MDGYRLSSYFNKDRDSIGGQINAGPIWDFNLAWWNADYCYGDDYTGWSYLFPQYCWWDGSQPPFWWERLLEDNAFKNKLRCRWNYLRSDILSTTRLTTLVNAYKDTLNTAQQRHFTAWPILGSYVWPNPSPLATTYTGELTHLKNWISNRTTWMDANLAGDCSNQPVFLLSFDGICQNNKTTLTWKTYDEKSVDHYEVQKKDNTGTFNTIGTTPANNLSGNKDYQWIENNTLVDHETYRLAIIPISGITDYSEVVRIKKCSTVLGILPETEVTNYTVSIEPNPCNTELYIRNNTNEPITGYDIYSVTGILLSTNRTVSGELKTSVKEIAQLNQGVYSIKIYSADKTIIKKLIKN